MHFYPHNIPDFNNATRHLTRVERSVYRDAIEHYYDTEHPFNSVQFDALAKRLMCRSEEEKQALRDILDEFFVEEDGFWRHRRCDREIAKYRAIAEAKSRAGKESAKKRQQKANRKGTKFNTCSTSVQQTKNYELRTKNQDKPKSENKFSDADLSLAQVIYQRVLDVAPKTKPPNYDRWADDIRLMRQQDKHKLDEIWKVFEFANTDDFWKTNILSPGKLREKFSTLHSKMVNGGSNGNSRPGNNQNQSRSDRADQAVRDYLSQF